jgi:transposase
MPKAERDQLLRELKSVEGLSIRQIARITGVSYQMVYLA